MIATHVDKQVIHDSLRSWEAEVDSLDAQLADSLAALEAYQTHLDAWQKQLVIEREELRLAKAELDQNAGNSTENEQSQADGAQLTSAQQQIAALKDELHRLERSRDELAVELQHLRADDRGGRSATSDSTRAADASRPAQAGKGHARSASPVLGSIVEQFGKLRQQRALDRQSGKPPGRVKD